MQTVVVLVGVPGSGKSTAARPFVEAGFTVVNQDTLGDRRACEDAFLRALGSGQSVVVDRCNIDERQRSTWVRLAYEGGRSSQQPVRVRLVALQLLTPVNVCIDRVKTRVGHPTLKPDAADEVVPRFAQDLQRVRPQEGFHEVYEVREPAQLPHITSTILAGCSRPPSEPNSAGQQSYSPWQTGSGSKRPYEYDSNRAPSPNGASAPPQPSQHPASAGAMLIGGTHSVSQWEQRMMAGSGPMGPAGGSTSSWGGSAPPYAGGSWQGSYSTGAMGQAPYAQQQNPHYNWQQQQQYMSPQQHQHQQYNWQQQGYMPSQHQQHQQQHYNWQQQQYMQQQQQQYGYSNGSRSEAAGSWRSRPAPAWAADSGPPSSGFSGPHGQHRGWGNAPSSTGVAPYQGFPQPQGQGSSVGGPSSPGRSRPPRSPAWEGGSRGAHARGAPPSPRQRPGEDRPQQPQDSTGAPQDASTGTRWTEKTPVNSEGAGRNCTTPWTTPWSQGGRMSTGGGRGKGRGRKGKGMEGWDQGFADPACQLKYDELAPTLPGIAPPRAASRATTPYSVRKQQATPKAATPEPVGATAEQGAHAASEVAAGTAENGVPAGQEEAAGVPQATAEAVAVTGAADAVPETGAPKAEEAEQMDAEAAALPEPSGAQEVLTEPVQAAEAAAEGSAEAVAAVGTAAAAQAEALGRSSPDIPMPQQEESPEVARRRALPILLFDLNGTLTSHTAKRYSAGVNKMRPGLPFFLRLANKFRLGIFTSSTLRTVSVVRGLVEAEAGGPLFEPGLVLYREHTAPVPKEHVQAGGHAWDTVKPLNRWFKNLHRVLLFDDDAFKAVPGEESNMVRVPCWLKEELACGVLEELVNAVEEELGGLGPDDDVRLKSAAISARLFAVAEAQDAACGHAGAHAEAAMQGGHDADDEDAAAEGAGPEGGLGADAQGAAAADGQAASGQAAMDGGAAATMAAEDPNAIDLSDLLE